MSYLSKRQRNIRNMQVPEIIPYLGSSLDLKKSDKLERVSVKLE